MDASANGAKHLNFASERFDVHPEEDEQIANKKEEQSKLTMVLGVAAVGVLSFIFGKVIFTAVPALLAELTRPIFPSHTGQIIVESVIKPHAIIEPIYTLFL